MREVVRVMKGYAVQKYERSSGGNGMVYRIEREVEEGGY